MGFLGILNLCGPEFGNFDSKAERADRYRIEESGSFGKSIGFFGGERTMPYSYL